MNRKEVLSKRHNSLNGLGGRILLLSFITASAIFFYSCSPPRKGSTITNGKARFEFLTPSLVRMEYAPSGRFVNAPTVVVKRRNWPKVAVQTTNKNGWLTMQSSRLKVRYRLHSGPFTKSNLTVAWRDSTGSGQWHPGEKDSLNLGGILHSLNGIHKGHLPKVQPGLLSRNGYFLLKDSHTPVWDSAKAWLVSRPDTNDQDWYFFAYGRDYKLVLYEFAKLSGRIPMIPRYTLGTWITDLNFEYFPGTPLKGKETYNEAHLKNEILKFRSEGIPLDVMVLDFGWHNYGWQGGYDWSPVITRPQQFISWLHNHGIKIALNDHPFPGHSENNSDLAPQDSHTKEIRKLLGLPPLTQPTFKMILSKPWQIALDPNKVGIKEHWFKIGPANGSWKPFSKSKNSTAFKNKEIVWYRKFFHLPENLPDSLYLIFNRLQNFDLYVNGKKVKHFGRHDIFHPYATANVTAFLNPGTDNLVTLRCRINKGKKESMGLLPVRLQNKRRNKGIHFNLTVKKQAEIFTSRLLGPILKEGVNFWWIDGGIGFSRFPGLNNQLWTNKVYYDFTQKFTHKRGFIFSRYGGWGNQRYPALFTGDTYSQWPVLAYEIPFTAQGGNVLMPYITHDIGGFHGAKIPFSLYARWVEFGAFSPILRLHSAHENPQEGNVRMPWTYGKKGIALVKKYFNLRYKLLPYIYTYVRQAYDKALPLVRPLYLEYPNLPEAYSHPHEYFFGDQMLVAPVIDSTGMCTIYLPPGQWFNFFSGKSYKGNQTFTAHYNLDQIPVFVKAGSIIPEQKQMSFSNQKPLDTLVLRIFGPTNGSFNLYEDDGISLDYRKGKYAWTPLKFMNKGKDNYQLTIGPTTGEFSGQVGKRSYIVKIQGIQKPSRILINNQLISKKEGLTTNWSWNAQKSILSVTIPGSSIRKSVILNIKIIHGQAKLTRALH